MSVCVFFFQAEDGIRDGTVTGVQTCALPISPYLSREHLGVVAAEVDADAGEVRREIEGATAFGERGEVEIGRASCRERVEMAVVGGAARKKTESWRGARDACNYIYACCELST